MKDSGDRQISPSGMVREPTGARPRYELMLAKGLPLDAQLLTRVALHLSKGAEKYNARNWELANSVEEAERMRESAFRHFMAWLNGDTDEDHAAALVSNVIFVETTEYKLRQGS